LVGITPQGTISFVSEPWGGRTSDVYLTENCGMLQNLLPGDTVMADRASLSEMLLVSIALNSKYLSSPEESLN